MKRIGWARRSGVCAAVMMAVGLTSASAWADQKDDGLSLKIAGALNKDRVFVRAGVIYVKIKTKSGDTRDVTGPVLTTAEFKNVAYNNTTVDFGDPASVQAELDELNAIAARYPLVNWNIPGVEPGYVLYEAFSRNPSPNPALVDGVGALVNTQFGIPLLTNLLDSKGLVGIGTPPGIKGEASPETGTAGISLGYYLGDDYNWVVEAYVLAKPVSSSVYARGTVSTPDGLSTKRIEIDGQKIIKTKLFPPLLMFGRYWGDKHAKFRPYTGAIGMYAMFYDTKATPALNTYVGGSNPGDTTVSIKNTFGLGPVIGMKYQFSDQWHASLNVAHVKLRTEATLVTRNTMITSQTPVLKDLGVLAPPIIAGETTYAGPQCNLGISCDLVRQNGGLTSLVSKLIAGDRGQSNLGTYVRKTETELDNTIFFLSLGRSF